MKKILEMIFKCSSCSHANAISNSNEGYCPDCGAYVKKYYYIVRCSCCEVKREAKAQFSEVKPKDKFCMNCGNANFYVEKHDAISFIDIHFALQKKEEVDSEVYTLASSQVWADENSTCEIKLLSKAV